jgi:large subunit ribosomal protein L24
MKKEFNKNWKASNQPRKQRKYLANAPFHLREKMLCSHLSKELRQKYGRRSFALRKGDTVKVMNGEYRGKTGKIGVIDLTKIRVTIEGIQITKKDGSKVNIFFKPCKLLITELNLDDAKRQASIKKEDKNKEQKNKPEAKK